MPDDIEAKDKKLAEHLKFLIISFIIGLMYCGKCLRNFLNNEWMSKALGNRDAAGRVENGAFFDKIGKLLHLLC